MYPYSDICTFKIKFIYFFLHFYQISKIYFSKFNTLQYSDAQPVAKIDAKLKEAQDELAHLTKTKHEYQEQLEKQNSEFLVFILSFKIFFKYLSDKKTLRTLAQRSQRCSTSRR